jgi:hypothetical protein
MSWIDILPFVGGLIAAVAGGALIADAALTDEVLLGERRQVLRAQRSRAGQGCLGGSLVCTAIILLSGGSSPLAIALTFVGSALLAIGVGLNWRYLAERITGPPHRGQDEAPTGGDRVFAAIAATATPPAYGWPLTRDE